MSDIVITKLNESFIRIECDPDIAYELSEAFTFEVPGAKFAPLYRAGAWDGKIRIFNLGKRTMPYGLLEEIKKFGTERNYNVIDDVGCTSTTLTLAEVMDYTNSLGLMNRAPSIIVRDYQYAGIHTALKNKRGILCAATGAGKSLILGVICRYLTEELNLRVLIIVPTIGLTTQLKADFADYFHHTGWSADDNVHCISAGVDKKVTKPITISTFQSIYKMNSDWLNLFGCMIADEAHKVIAKTITGIFEKATAVEYKLGCTGTLHDMKCNMLVMKGITGPVYDIASTAVLIENKQLVPLDIKAIVLNYPKETCKMMKKVEYDDEINFIVTNSKRTKFVANLALKCKGTTLVLFRFVDKQGIPLYNLISERSTDRNIHYIDGGVKGSERETIRNEANTTDDIIVASFATFATGVNLPAIENIIFAHPTKSPITILQSIGRGLRLKDGKLKCTLYDIADNLTNGRTPNTTYRHLGDRLKTYTQTGFSFNIINVPFNDQ